MGFRIQSDGSGSDRLIVPAGGFRLPVNEKTSVLEWDSDNNGRTMNDLYMDGMAIFNFAITKVHTLDASVLGIEENKTIVIRLYPKILLRIDMQHLDTALDALFR
jgi:3-oxoacyl-[acyl-carrier-protein] synthase III